MRPQPVDRLEILVVTDNYADVLLPSAPGVIRAPLNEDDALAADTLLAEHGLCLLLTATRGERVSRLILDAGYSPVATPRNLLRIDPALDRLCGLVVSHGHEDHVGAIRGVLEMCGFPPVIAHPEAFRPSRFFRDDDGRLFRIPELLRREDLADLGVEVTESEKPLLRDEVFLITGEIPRRTSFERGLPGAVREVNEELVHDPVLDDQAVVVDVDGLGLVVVSGCAHAGIVNTVRHARDLCDGRPIHAILGGFHLAGVPSRSAIGPTLDALLAEIPARVVPMHCTGVEAKRRFYERFGDRCVDSAVGTTFVFGRDID